MAKYELPKLPYNFNELEPFIDAQTVEIHYSKHHQTYTDKLNAALEAHPELGEKELEFMLKNLDSVPEDIRTVVRNHGGGYYNHCIYWANMTPEGKVSTEMTEVLSKKWTDLYTFKTEFLQKATLLFGSGWVWLVKDDSNDLSIVQTPNQDIPQSGKILLGVDVWEHAYYLKYQNKRADYLENWWKIINWEDVYSRFVT